MVAMLYVSGFPSLERASARIVGGISVANLDAILERVMGLQEMKGKSKETMNRN